MDHLTKLVQPIGLLLQNQKTQSIILWWLGTLVFVHLFLTYVIGLSIGFINPFLLKICNIQYSNKKVKVKIRSARLVLSVAQWTKVVLVLDGAEIDLKAVTTPTKPKETTGRESKEELEEKLSSFQEDKMTGIFPNNFIFRSIIRYYLLYFRFVGLKIFDLNIKWKATGINFNSEIFLSKISMHKHEAGNFGFKVSSRFFQQSVDNVEIIDTIALDIRGEVNLNTGLVSKIKVNFEVKDLSLPVMSLIRTAGKLKGPSHTRSEAHSSDVVKDDLYYLTKMYNKLCVLCVMVKYIEEINISFVGLSITQIPLAGSGILRCHKYKPLVLFDFRINSFVWNMQRMYFDSPGYGLNYDYHDKPYHIICNFTGISVKMHNTQNETWKPVMAIPVLNFTGTSNLAFQTIEAIKTHEASTAKLTVFGHVSEPVLDFSTDDINTATVGALDLRKYLHTIRAMHMDSTEPAPSGKSFADKWKILKRNFLYWPLLDIKLTVENPTVMVKSEFMKEYYKILVLNLSILALELKTERKTNGDTFQYVSDEKLDLRNLRCQYKNNHTGFDSSILSVEDIAIRHKYNILPDPSVGATLDLYNPSIDLSEIHSLRGLNHIFKEVDDKLRPLFKAYQDYLRTNCSSELPTTVTQESVSAEPDGTFNDERSAVQIINDLIPMWLESVKVSLHSSTVLLGSRSLLISKELMKNADPITQNDLVSGELRKIKLEFSTMMLSFLSGTPANDEEQSSGTSSLEDDDKGLVDVSSDLVTDSTRWRVRFAFEKLVGKILSERSSNKNVLKEKVFLKIPQYNGSLMPCYEPSEKLLINISISKVDMFYSVMAHFIIISSLHVIRNTVFEFLLNSPSADVQPSDPKKKKHSNVSTESFGSKLFKAVDINFELDFADLILVFPDKLKIRLELTRVSIMGIYGNPILLNSHYLRLCAESPTSPGYWSRIISSVDGSTTINIETIINHEDANWFDFSNECFHLTIPNQFVIYKVFENLSVTFKTWKQLHYSLKHNSNKMAIYPKVGKKPKIPNMNLKSKRIIFSMEDDPFESELNMIFQVGIMEQKMRVEKMNILEEKIAKELSEHRAKISKSSTFDKALLPNEHTKTFGSFIPSKISNLKDRVPRPLRHSQSVMDFEMNNEHGKSNEARAAFSDVLLAKERAENRVYRLKENFSTSWISRVKNYRKKLESEFQSNVNFLWGSLDPSRFPEEFNRKVLEFTNQPSLFNLILEGVDLSVGEPSCGLANVPQFIHDVGKGMPVDTEYSLIIPVHLDLKLSELRCHLRDYPLPFIFMPPTTRNQPAKLPGVRAFGNLVIAEQMIQSHAEVREVYVPLVPGCHEEEHDKHYSLEVPKTLTPIKVYTDLEWELNSELSTKVTWGTSYQPCIQQIMLNLDNFTKPPVDISEKVGFWDKLRCLFHARMKFHWNYGGELHIQFKGSKNPYAILGAESGFLLGFQENVCLAINAHDDPSRFMSAKADQVKFAVPNLIAEPLLVWSRHSRDSVLLADPDTNYQMSAFGYFLVKHDVVDIKKSDILKSVFIEKSVITLTGGVQFDMALGFERKINGTVERSNQFSPHYHVLLKNPKHIDNAASHDSYAGFRSDYIHMGFMLISTGNDAYNTVQLSPRAFRHFLQWWKMFSNTLAVRHGPLFGPAKATKKFSRHLYTIKYQFVFDPFFISHVYHDSEASTKSSESVECIGLKGRASKFVLDLHQRKEVMVDHNAKLGVTKKIMKMKFNVGKVDVENLDMRTLKGLFELIGDSPNELPTHDGKFSLETFDDDLSWLDIADFAEIAEPFLSNYKGSIFASPLLFTPRFIYDKHNDYGDKYQVDFDTNEKVEPFGKESFHSCSLGMSAEDTQSATLKDRIEELDYKLAQNVAQIEKLSTPTTLAPEVKKKISQLKVDNDQLRHSIRRVNDLLTVALEEANMNACDTAESPGLFPDCSSDDSFMNKYTVHNMLLKWNNTTRDIVYKIVYLFEMNSSIAKYLHYKSLAQLDDILASQRRSALEGDYPHSITRYATMETGISGPEDQDFATSGESRASERLENFKEELRDISARFYCKAHDDHLVRFISPQIQLQSEFDEDSCVLIVAPMIQMEVIAFDANETDDDYNENIFEQRYGVVLTDSSIFMFRQHELIDTGKQYFNSSSYGSTTNWPPWLGIELGYDSSLIADHVLMNKTSFNIRYDKVLASSYLSDFDDISKVSCDFSQAIFTCDAKQYYSLFNIITKLLMYNEPRAVRNKERESKMLLRLDLNELGAVRSRIYQLQEALKNADYILSNLSARRAILNELERDDLYIVINARYEAAIELHTLMHVSLVGNTDRSAEQSNDYQEWVIRADGIKLHMLDEHRMSFLDVILENSFFKRIERTDRSDRNVISIQNLEIINLDEESKFPVLFSGKKDVSKPKKKDYKEEDVDPLIHLVWHMDHPVGGIRLMRRFDIELQPIQISVEETTGHKIMRYAFPDDVDASSNIFSDDEADHSDTRSLNSSSSKLSFTRHNTKNGHAAEVSSMGQPLRKKSSLSSNIKKEESSINNSVENGTANGTANSTTNGTIGKISSISDDDDDGVDEMVKRASDYLSFISFNLKSTIICVTFRGNGSRRLINVSDFNLTLPTITLTNKTCTLLDLVNHLKKVIAKSLLSHTGSIIGNKIFKHGSKQQKYIRASSDRSLR